MTNVITLSLNPAIDVTLWVDDMQPGQEHRVRRERYESAGKAVNVSRALSEFGIQNHAVILAGEGNLHRYEQGLLEEGLDYELIPVPGYTRQNISMISEATQVTTRVLCQGFTVPYEAVEKLMTVLRGIVTPDSIVVISGRLPAGMSSTVFRKICAEIKEYGGRIALDCTGITLLDLEAIRPWVIKPNRCEFCAFIDKPAESCLEVVQAARQLLAIGVQQCIVSCDIDGLIYVNKEHAYQVEVPSVDVVSSVGAGDCALAGFVMASVLGQDSLHCAKTAAAFGTASCMMLGSLPPTKICAANMLARVMAKEII